MLTTLLAQADLIETAKAVGGLPTSTLLALVVGGLIYLYRATDAKLDKALASNDALQEARLADLKETMGLLSGKEHA
jgi:hypothetical protein